MVKKKADDRDLRIDVFMGDRGRAYRVTHIPSGVHAESELLSEALEAMNAGLEQQ